jgi:hypothetical protein
MCLRVFAYVCVCMRLSVCFALVAATATATAASSPPASPVALHTYCTIFREQCHFSSSLDIKQSSFDLSVLLSRCENWQSSLPVSQSPNLLISQLLSRSSMPHLSGALPVSLSLSHAHTHNFTPLLTLSPKYCHLSAVVPPAASERHCPSGVISIFVRLFLLFLVRVTESIHDLMARTS